MVMRRTGSPTKSTPRRRRPANGGSATSSPSPLRRVDSWHTDNEDDTAEAGERTRATKAIAQSNKHRIPSPTLRSTRRNASDTRPSEHSPPSGSTRTGTDSTSSQLSMTGRDRFCKSPDLREPCCGRFSCPSCPTSSAPSRSGSESPPSDPISRATLPLSRPPSLRRSVGSSPTCRTRASSSRRRGRCTA
jgi:hypothetical protein